MILLIGVNNLKGFTLVEVMISVLILGFGLTLVANSYIVALRGVNSTANNVGALSLAREKFDALEVSSLKDGLSASVAQSVLKSCAKNYDYKQEIVEITQPKDLAKSLVQACLSLSWREQNATKNVALSTYLPKQKQ